jgi:signal transduction histidine kinase/CheY-like chemotaxis protein
MMLDHQTRKSIFRPHPSQTSEWVHSDPAPLEGIEAMSFDGKEMTASDETSPAVGTSCTPVIETDLSLGHALSMDDLVEQTSKTAHVTSPISGDPSADSANQAHLLRLQTTLARFGELALRSDNLDEILMEACRLAGEALGTRLAKVVELQEDGKTLIVRAGVGWKPGVVGKTTITAEEDTSEGHALRTGEPMISPDVATETRFRYAPFLIENGVKAVANVLIIGAPGKRPFGILQVDSRRPRQFTENDTAFLRSYANLLAATVDRLRVVQEIRDGEARLRLALETGELGSWQLDIASGVATRTARYDQIFGNREASATWSQDAFLGHVLYGDRESVATAFRCAAEARKDLHVQCRIRRADDASIRWIEVRGRADGPSSRKPTHLLGIVADITARKRAEEAMQRSNELLEASVAARTVELSDANARLKGEAEERGRVEEALRQSHKMEAIGQLTGGLAHDFNNLLTGITGSLELIRKRIQQGRIGEIDRYMETAMASALRAAALTHRLLAFSRRQTLDPRPTDMNRLVNGLEELMQRTVGPGIRLDVRMAPDVWSTLCDPNQLENALLNLVINARDAMPDGGILAIETANTTITADDVWNQATGARVPAGEYAMLSVSDDGAGMAPDVVARAFDPFFTTKPLGQGTGLGLSMIYGFVKQSGGYIVLRSVPSKGTIVTIHMPRHVGEADQEVQRPVLALAPAPQNTVVLVVDDEPAVRIVICDVLADAGYAVLDAADGRSGMSVLETDARIDLLVTDVGLPGGMNGRQLADAARMHRPELKILFVTGYAESSIFRADTIDEGMAVMTKPFATEDLARTVQGMIEKTHVEH